MDIFRSVWSFCYDVLLPHVADLWNNISVFFTWTIDGLFVFLNETFGIVGGLITLIPSMVLPRYFLDLTIIEFLLATGIPLFIGVTLWKWIKDVFV